MTHIGRTTVKWVLLLAYFCVGIWLMPAEAQIRYELFSPQGKAITITTVDQKREADSLVLYTPDYGQSTRTNAFGVEVSASPVPNEPNRYKVNRVSNIWTCQQTNRLEECGNMPIPENGLVLSASGNKRKPLLDQYNVGDTFVLSPNVVYESRSALFAIDPTPQTNPKGAGFPGYRGGNQLVAYTKNFGQPSTGTNEFGFEVTVRNNRVVEAQGANSTIPQEEDSYVLSGHGKARQWLLLNAPIGAKIYLQDRVVISRVDRDTYLYSVNTTLDKLKQRNAAIPPPLQQRITKLNDSALAHADEDVAKQALTLKRDLTHLLWQSYPALPQGFTKGIWHRPDESTVADIRKSLDFLKNTGIDTLFLETYLHGDPIFPSQTFSKYGIPQTLPFKLTDNPSADLLQIWLDEAHKRNIKVHVWFQTFYAGNRQTNTGYGSILNTYPEWANIQRSAVGKETLVPSTLEAGGYFLDPAHPQARAFLLDLIDEVVSRYPIDGFQLDYIRYPSALPSARGTLAALTSWGYTDAARQQFMAQTKADPLEINPTDTPELWTQWNQFKTGLITQFVKTAHDRINAKKPNLPISAAVFPDVSTSTSRKHQDWLTWAKQGWVDFICPMTLTSALETIAHSTREVQESAKVPVVTGIFGPFNGNNPTDVVEQVWTAAQLGASGVALFDTAHFTQAMSEALREGLFRKTSNTTTTHSKRSVYNKDSGS